MRRLSQSSSGALGPVIGPTLVNGWVNYPGWAEAGYWKSADGVVACQGVVRNGTLGAAIFTLPVGFRPALEVPFAVISSPAVTATGHISVAASGAVAPFGGVNTMYSLCGVEFRV